MPDLFISYAHVDRHWVDVFAPLLEQRVNQYAGRAKPDRLWKDNRLGGNTPLKPEIDTQLAQAECLLVCLSTGYLASEWCRYELATFSARTGAHSGRIFCLELDRISPGHKPAILTEALGYRFWWQDANSKRTYPLTATHAGFDNRLIDLARDIAGVLNPPQPPLPKEGSQPAPPQTAFETTGTGGDFLQRKRAAAESRRNLLLEKLTRQQEALVLETRVEEQMRMEKLIADTEAALQKLDRES